MSSDAEGCESVWPCGASEWTQLRVVESDVSTILGALSSRRPAVVEFSPGGGESRLYFSDEEGELLLGLIVSEAPELDGQALSRVDIEFFAEGMSTSIGLVPFEALAYQLSDHVDRPAFLAGHEGLVSGVVISERIDLRFERTKKIGDDDLNIETAHLRFEGSASSAGQIRHVETRLEVRVDGIDHMLSIRAESD